MAGKKSKYQEESVRKDRYINPLTDFGFKRIFGTEANKDLLIHFLESVLDISGGIKELHYDNPEKKGRMEVDRNAFFDLLCTTGKDERIIIEMQKISQKFFMDRVLYYATFPIQEQGEKGDDWNFELNPVYSVNILDFNMGKRAPAGKFASHVQLLDRETCKVFYDKLTFVFMELPRFKKKAHELKTNFDRWMFVLKYMSKLHNLPETLRNRVFEKLFRVAEILKLSPEERKDYDQSLKSYRDMYLVENERINEIKRLKEINKEQGAELIFFQKQNAELKNNTVRILLEIGIPVQKIAVSMGISASEIEQIRAQLPA
jgi:predicted transposase/invertase (TIGR01784 family)